MSFLSRRRKQAAIARLSAAYSQEVNTTPDDEQRLKRDCAHAWAAGERRAKAFFANGVQEQIAAASPHQLFTFADIESTEIPGTPEASAFVTSFVRTIEGLVKSDEFRASLLRKRADQLDELQRMKEQAPQTWAAAETLADECFEEHGRRLTPERSDAQLEDWIRDMTATHMKVVAELHDDMSTEQLKAFGTAFHRRLSELLRESAPY
jgi:hypothetical protein